MQQHVRPRFTIKGTDLLSITLAAIDGMLGGDIPVCRGESLEMAAKSISLFITCLGPNDVGCIVCVVGGEG